MIYERVRSVVRNETFTDCTGVCYGVPLLPEEESALEDAARSLADVLGTPAWLAAVTGVLRQDGTTKEIEVQITDGYPIPLLPPRWHGLPIRAVYPGRDVPTGV